MGRNTRSLLAGLKTIRGYENRLKKVLEQDEKDRTQSNGAMMRMAILSLFSLDDVVTDCNITNPNTTCVDTNVAYWHILRSALLDKDCLLPPLTPQVEEVVYEPTDTRDLNEGKGWCLTALWCLIKSLSFESYSECMSYVITQGGEYGTGDTDTNACIVGAYIGAKLGYEKMMEEEDTRYNFSVMMSYCESEDRLREYVPWDFHEMCSKVYELLERS